jgi:hypothetical protein
MPVISYNREDAVAYARQWAFRRNPKFYDFNYIGGDCTNFASQCIYAGAKVMNYTPVYGWYFRSLSDRSASWSGVEYLYNFLTTNDSVGPFARVVDEDEILPGDIIQLGRADGDFYHTLVVTEIYPEILVAAHTNDVLDRPLSSYNYDVARFLHIEGVRT